MRYKSTQKEETRDRILAAAGRCFRKAGYSGIGVDGLAKEAGVTSGAFYGHFNSKKAAFSAAIVSGMEELRAGIAGFRQECGKAWWPEFARFYLTQKRTCDLAESCGLQSLTPEVARSEESIRSVFEAELLKTARLATEEATLATGQPTIDATWVKFAMLIGGVTLARAVVDKKLSNQIAAAIQDAVASMQQT